MRRNACRHDIMKPELNDFNSFKIESEPLLQFSKTFIAFLYTFYLKLPMDFDKNDYSVNKEQIAKYLKEKAGINSFWDEKADYSKEFMHAEDFFRQPKYFFEKRYRFKLDDFYLFCSKSVSDCICHEPHKVEVFLTIFPHSNEAILLLNLALYSCTTDDIIFIRHCILENRFSLTVASNSRFLESQKLINLKFQNYILSKYVKMPLFENWYADGFILSRYIKLIRFALETDSRKIINLAEKIDPDNEMNIALTKTFLIEIQEINNLKISSPEAYLLSRYPKQIYGLLVGDEGWRFVPRAIALARIAGRWSTRNFLSIICIDRSILMFNFALTKYYSKYVFTQKKLRDNYGKDAEGYFTSSYIIAGLQHGPLLNLEIASLIRFYIDNYELFFEREYFQGPFSAFIYRMIGQSGLKENLDKRDAIRNALEKISDANKIWELKGLYNLIDNNISNSRDIKALEDKLKAIEDALHLEYEMRNNRYILIIAVIGIIIAIGQIAIPLYIRK